MTNAFPSFTIGIEEEYLIVNNKTKELIVDPPEDFIRKCNENLVGTATNEFMRCQVEVGTRVCKTIQGAAREIAAMRKRINEVSSEYGLNALAVSTHPFSSWKNQKITDSERYNTLAEDFQALVRRMMISGMHVHVGIEDEDLRIDLMNQIAYFLPHMLALSTSSPFWQGQHTGLKSYRLAVWDEIPRTGLPEHFESFGEYQRYVNVLINADLIEDATKIWWDLRPSARYPTLELRILDNCPLIEDSICLAALFCCLLRMLVRLRRENQRWRLYSRLMINENRWRAQRYGIDRGLVDFGKGKIHPMHELFEDILGFIMEDAEALNCVDEINHIWTILDRGTSAHRQVALYEKCKADGMSEREAQEEVVNMLIEETTRGLDKYVQE